MLRVSFLEAVQKCTRRTTENEKNVHTHTEIPDIFSFNRLQHQARSRWPVLASYNAVIRFKAV